MENNLFTHCEAGHIGGVETEVKEGDQAQLICIIDILMLAFHSECARNTPCHSLRCHMYSVKLVSSPQALRIIFIVLELRERSELSHILVNGDF